MTCDRCLKPSTDGEHGIGQCPYEPRTIWGGVRQDTIIGGFMAENAWREPRYFDSQKRYEKALDESGLMLKPKPGGGHTITADTLKWAEERVKARTKSVPIEERLLEETITVRAEQ